jgi:uncharacterized membrane protein YidH (DUF202 family)
MALGFVVDRLGLISLQLDESLSSALPLTRLSFWSGAGLISLGVVMSVFAGIRYARFARRYRESARPDPGHGVSWAALFIFAVAILGLGMLAFLVRATVL